MNDWEGHVSIGLGWVYYNGPVGDIDFHRHYAVQFCFPSRGDLSIETRNQLQTVDRIFVVGSNVDHRLSSTTGDAKLLYVEPCLVEENLRRFSINDVAVLDLPRQKLDALNAVLDIASPALDNDLGREIVHLIWPDNIKGERIDSDLFPEIDPRISSCLIKIAQSESLNLSLDQLAEGSQLSPSRFRRLFSNQVGMPLKSYLLWTKLQRAIQSLTHDGSLTNAAHLAGFSDSAHLARTFRQTFGFSPSQLTKQAQFSTDKRIP